MSSWIRDNGGVLAIAVIAVAAVGGYFELRLAATLPKAVQAETDAIPVITEDRVRAIESDISDIKQTLVRQDEKTDKIIDILLEQ